MHVCILLSIPQAWIDPQRGVRHVLDAGGSKRSSVPTPVIKGHRTSPTSWLFPSNPEPQHQREKKQTNPNGGTTTKHPASPPQNRQGHPQQGKSEKMSQPRGAQGGVTARCHAGAWQGDRERHQWENGRRVACGLDSTSVSMLGPYCDKCVMLMSAVNSRGSRVCFVWEHAVLSLQLFHPSKTVWDFLAVQWLILCLPM